MTTDNVAALTRGLVYLEKRHAEQAAGVTDYTPVDFQTFYDLLADDVEFEVATTTQPPAEEAVKPPSERAAPWNVIGCVHRGKESLIAAFSTDQSDIETWEVQHPLVYLTDGGDTVAVLLSERYLKMGQPVPWSKSVMLFEFSDGKIIRYTHIADMSGHFGAVGSALREPAARS